MQIGERDSIQNSAPSIDKSESNLAGQVFEVLRRHIVTGELRPNQRLVESEIAKELGVSRTPVREALKRLEVTGYTSTLPGGGLLIDVPQLVTFTEDRKELVINRKLFHRQVKKEFADYICELRRNNPPNEISRQNFKKKMNFICRVESGDSV